jgi:hypothetical protein
MPNSLSVHACGCLGHRGRCSVQALSAFLMGEQAAASARVGGVYVVPLGPLFEQATSKLIARMRLADCHEAA